MARHHVFLIPGFFGFANLGELKYFAHVREVLTEAFEAERFRAVIHYVHTAPTASLKARAQRLAATVAAEAPRRKDVIHLVGHSTGGLDARLLAAPSADLGTEALAERVRTIVCVASPHHGTPLAGSLLGATGGTLLRLLSLATVDVVRNGRLSVGAARGLLRVMTAVTDRTGLGKAVPEQLFDLLLQDFSVERRDQVAAFFEEVARDQSLIADLRPANLPRFDDHPDVRLGSVITRARRPGLVSSVFKQGMDPYGQAMHAVFRKLYDMSGFSPAQAPPAPSDTVRQQLLDAWGDLPRPASNDGIVPSMSQVRGEIIHVTRADHLDVVGHFGDPRHDPPHYDWLPSGSDFRRRDFERLWQDVARYITDAGRDS